MLDNPTAKDATHGLSNDMKPAATQPSRKYTNVETMSRPAGLLQLVTRVSA